MCRSVPSLDQTLWQLWLDRVMLDWRAQEAQVRPEGDLDMERAEWADKVPDLEFPLPQVPQGAVAVLLRSRTPDREGMIMVPEQAHADLLYEVSKIRGRASVLDDETLRTILEDILVVVTDLGKRVVEVEIDLDSELME